MAKTRTPGIYTRELKDGTTVYDVVATVSGRQKVSRGYRTLRAAQQALDELRVALRRGRQSSAPARLTLGDYLTERWLIAAEQQLNSGESVRGYRHQVRRIKEAIVGPSRKPFGSFYLTKLTALDIEDFKTALQRSGTSPTTSRLIYERLKQALRQALRWELIDRNPCDLVDPPRKARYRPPELTIDMVKRLLESAGHTPYRALIELAVLTGMRWGELTALQWQDVDFAASSIRVMRSKTEKGRRAIALGSGTLELLRVHRLQQMRYFKDLGAEPPALVFVSEMGAKLNQGNFAHRWWSTIRTRAGVPTLHFHDMRHIHATLMAKAGTHPRIMADRLGHTDSAMSLEIYTHLDYEDQRPAAEAIEGLLGIRETNA